MFAGLPGRKMKLVRLFSQNNSTYRSTFDQISEKFRHQRKASCCALPKLSNFLLDPYQFPAHQGLSKSLDISISLPALFANLAASRFCHIPLQKITQLRY